MSKPALATPSAPPARPANSREQDLFLLAKQRYVVPSGMRPANAARLLVGWHNLHDPDAMSWRDAAQVCIGDLKDAGCLKGVFDDAVSLTEFLCRRIAPNTYGPGHVAQALGPDHSQPGGYFAVLIQALLSEAALCRVRDGDTWLLEIEDCEPDPAFQAWLVDHG